MRTFYLFRINQEFMNLTARNPYNLYKTMEDIYYLKRDEVDIGYNMFKQIVLPFNQERINDYLFYLYKNDDHYTKYNNNHMINNFYTDEQSKLIVNKTFLLLKTTKVKPTFFENLKVDNGIFVCDFVNKDYFWLEQMI